MRIRVSSQMGSPPENNNNHNHKSPSSSSFIASTTHPHHQSVPLFDSPIFNYINNLSPIKPVKGTSTGQAFPGFNSPPLIFTSERTHTHRRSLDFKSTECHISSQEDNNTTDSNMKNSSLKNPEDAHTKMTDLVNPVGSVETFGNEVDNLLASPTFVEQSQEDKEVENDGQNQSICRNLTSVDHHYEQPHAAQGGQSQLGKRRRLQFEAAQESIVENDLRSPNSSYTAAVSEVLDSSTSKTTKGPSVIVSKPSGIGLHLNSIVNTISTRHPSGGGKKLISIGSQIQDNLQCPSVSSNSNLVENVEEYAHQTPYSNAESLKMSEYHEKFNQGSLNSEQVNRYNRPNPKKRRKKTESSGDGCKNCNCKKTKCLKLYCDCFAAGIYCADSCSCEGCLNRPEYENTVLETRQQIETRDPLAFAPKVVSRPTQPPQMQMLEDGDQVTPLAGRHKRGCNCKKSMCIKKYCECYQANVGCSEGCRCEGCQNTYGMKGGRSLIRETGIESFNENVSNSFGDKKLKAGRIKLRSSLPELSKPHNVAPQTPSFQCSTYGNDASETHVFPGGYVQSPESECPSYVTTTPKSPNDASNFDMMTEASNKTNKVDQESYRDGEFMDEFSPGDWSSTSRSQLLPPNLTRFSSIGFHGSSVTPVTMFNGAKPSFNIMDDDTPNILRDSSIQQHNKVRVSSPNKKRVSPPRLRLHELGSSTLKSGRKFILKAIPSFPPLTPCIDSKHTNQPPDSSH